MESPLLFTSIPIDGDQTDEDTHAQEQALVEAAKHDASAFATLYELYFARVSRYLRIRVQQEDDVVDLAQQVFLQALDGLPHYQSRGLFPWVTDVWRVVVRAGRRCAALHSSPLVWEPYYDMRRRVVEWAIWGVEQSH